jgi:hypothetical protein
MPVPGKKTIAIQEDLKRRAHLAAIAQGVTLEEFVTEIIERSLSVPFSEQEKPSKPIDSTSGLSEDGSRIGSLYDVARTVKNQIWRDMLVSIESQVMHVARAARSEKGLEDEEVGRSRMSPRRSKGAKRG